MTDLCYDYYSEWKMIIIILIVIGALSEGRSPAAPEELSIADLEK